MYRLRSAMYFPFIEYLFLPFVLDGLIFEGLLSFQKDLSTICQSRGVNDMPKQRTRDLVVQRVRYQYHLKKMKTGRKMKKEI